VLLDKLLYASGLKLTTRNKNNPGVTLGMSNDPRETINQSAMTVLQIVIITIMIGLNALDGYDILSISFASPGIADEWGVDLAALGIVLSMELIGMGLGSLFLGSMADKLGRRPTTLFCLLVMASGMFMVTTTSSIFSLSFWRVVTGVGIGGLLTAINAVTAEFSNTSRRHLCVSIMAIGYPIGGVVGGSFASMLLANHDWRSVFYLGASVTSFFIPVYYFLVPESVHWLARKQPFGALRKINKTLKKLGHAAIAELPLVAPDERSKSVGDIFSTRLLPTTLIVSCAYFLHITTFYFILKWVPKIVADMGFAASSAGGVLVWANVGGALGGTTFGLLTLKIDLKKLTIGTIFFSAIFVAIFGQTPADLSKMSMFCALAGFFANAGVVGLYAIVAHAFPTHARAFGTGFVIGFGRGGSVLSPILAGFLLELGMILPFVAMVMATGSLISAIVLLFLKLRSDSSSESVEDGEKESSLEHSAAYSVHKFKKAEAQDPKQPR
jgi:benzoate transport